MYEKQYSKFLRILITGILYIGYFSISSSLAQISEGGLPPAFNSQVHFEVKS